MKKLQYIILSIVSLSFLPACSSHEESAPTDTGLSYHRIAGDMLSRRAPFDSIIAVQQKAVEELRRGTSADNAIDVLQRMGYLYSRTGRYDIATDYLLEAVDSLDRLTPDEVDGEAAAYLLGNLANQYVRMNMYDEALDANRRALQYCDTLDVMFACNLWRMRGGLFKGLGNRDSVMRCYDIALSYVDADSLPKLTASVVCDRAAYIIEHSDMFTLPEVRQAVSAFENSDYPSQPSKIGYKVTEGEGKVLLGDITAGIKLMEEGLEAVRAQQDVEMIQYAQKYLLKAYAKAGYTDRLAALFPEYDAMCDTMMNREKINSVMTSEFRFRARKKDMEAQMWKERSATARKIITLQWIAIILAILIATIVTVSILRKLRFTRRSREAIHQRLQAMLARQKEVNTTIETLNSHIEELNREIEGRADTENIRKLIAEMPSCLLSESQEALFRRYFSQIYPRFIPAMRRDYPAVTTNDELVAMLIYLKYSSEEIALCLGISKQSVNSARYRLRKKLDLDKETDLNSFLLARKG